MKTLLDLKRNESLAARAVPKFKFGHHPAGLGSKGYATVSLVMDPPTTKTSDDSPEKLMIRNHQDGDIFPGVAQFSQNGPIITAPVQGHTTQNGAGVSVLTRSNQKVLMGHPPAQEEELWKPQELPKLKDNRLEQDIAFMSSLKPRATIISSSAWRPWTSASSSSSHHIHDGYNNIKHDTKKAHYVDKYQSYSAPREKQHEHRNHHQHHHHHSHHSSDNSEHHKKHHRTSQL